MESFPASLAFTEYQAPFQMQFVSCGGARRDAACLQNTKP